MEEKSERRRETRLEVNNTHFHALVPGKGPTSEFEKIAAKVTNISRLGLGIEFTALSTEEAEKLFPIEATISGELQYAGEKFFIACSVRVRKGKTFGLEFCDLSPETNRKLRGVLTPSYIARDIHQIAPEHLGDHVRALYQGDDFECIIFKPGLHNAKTMTQIFWRGRVVEVVDDVARFVPGLLVREAGSELTGGSLLKSFSNLSDDGTKKQLQDFFVSLGQMFKAWPQCPLELLSLVRKHTPLS